MYKHAVELSSCVDPCFIKPAIYDFKLWNYGPQFLPCHSLQYHLLGTSQLPWFFFMCYCSCVMFSFCLNSWGFNELRVWNLRMCRIIHNFQNYDKMQISSVLNRPRHCLVVIKKHIFAHHLIMFWYMMSSCLNNSKYMNLELLYLSL